MKSQITIKKIVDDYPFLPFTTTVEWYLKALQKRSWHRKFIETMQKNLKTLAKEEVRC